MQKYEILSDYNMTFCFFIYLYGTSYIRKNQFTTFPDYINHITLI